ncbi:MAG: HPP family protein [Pseudomonadota bacterium]
MGRQSTFIQPAGDQKPLRSLKRPAWRLLDPNFQTNASFYAAQCMLATVTIFAVLLALDSVTQTVLVASLGASSFIAFTMPHVEASRPRYLLGGYLMGTLTGCTFSLLGAGSFATLPSAGLVLAALATGSAIFLMVITDTEHPPAAALALGYALNDWNGLTVGVVFAGIVAIALIKECGKSNMKNLL